MNIRMRNLKAEDSQLIDPMLSRIQVFEAEDRALAMELVHIALEQPGQQDYVFIMAANPADHPEAFACFGPTPLTKGTFDLYWIAVDPTCTGKGLGSLLLQEVEAKIKERNGRLLVIETSSAPAYALTRQFYIKNGCALAECLPDFYQDGEDRVTFIKRL